MEETILIPIDTLEQIEQVLAILDAIVKPGSRVVVALRQPERDRKCMMGHWGFMLTGMESMHAVFMDGQERRFSLEESQAREKLARWQRALYPKQVAVEVVVCRGSMRPLIEGAKRNGQLGLLMTPARTWSPFSWIAEQFSQSRKPLHRPAKPAAVMLRPI